MIQTFRAKVLQRFWEKYDRRGLRPDWVVRIGYLLDALDHAARPEDLNLPGFGFHALVGNHKGRYALTVSRNWRITFEFVEGQAVQIDLEDYHG